MEIPAEISKTLEWLIQTEEYNLAYDLTLVIARFLPPQSPETSDFLAMVFHRMKRYDQALHHAEKTVALLPDQIEARYNLARCLHSAGKTVLAEEQIRQVIAVRSDWIDPQLDQAMYICAQGRFDEAESLLHQLRGKMRPGDPHHSIIDFNLAWHQIRHGQLKEGLIALSSGRNLKVFGSRMNSYPKPRLKRETPIAGKKILIVGEAGAGDEITNVRFAKKIHDRGGVCLWATNQKMTELFSRVEGVDKVFDLKDILALNFDYWVPAMDLFSTLDLERQDLSPKAYLSADSKFLKKWKAKIRDHGNLKVGLRWQGNPLYEQDLYRSVPFSLYREFFKIQGAEFYSLQRDAGAEELLSSDPVVNLAEDLKSWEDTAAAISLLDVVVTSCTSIAHLSGALGKKTLLLTPMLSYYVWASPGEKSIWYEDVKLFRQEKFRDWKSEVRQVFFEISRLASKRLQTKECR